MILAINVLLIFINFTHLQAQGKTSTKVLLTLTSHWLPYIILINKYYVEVVKNNSSSLYHVDSIITI